jgi:BirA family biotin operon repressor/biotin-[acetyl-CoA-carboxylase] ligase
LFAQTPTDHTPKGPFIILSIVESTNNYAMAKLHAALVGPGTCFQAVEQTAGKGQRGKIWQSTAGQNITLSIILPAFHHISYPFVESAALALSCYHFIKDLGVRNVSIKWPNDVYIGDRKAAGILVENVYRGTEWMSSVAGIGINVNQTEFTENAGKAISIKQATGQDHDIIVLGRCLHLKVMEFMNALYVKSPTEIMEEYNSRLYKKGSTVKLKKGPQVFSTVIKEVSLSGELLTCDTLEQQFAVGEVEFL